MIDAEQLRQLLSGKSQADTIFCCGLGLITAVDTLYTVELQFGTSQFSQKNQSILCKRAGLLGYDLAVGDYVIVLQARSLDNAYVSKLGIRCGYIVDKVDPAKKITIELVDSITIQQGGADIVRITPSKATFSIPVEAPSVTAGGVKLETHTHNAGGLVAPNGPVTGVSGGPI